MKFCNILFLNISNLQRWDGINADPNAQSAIIHVPGNANLYYLISRGLDGNMYYHTIDLSQQGNAPSGSAYGAVVNKNNLLYSFAGTNVVGTNHGSKLAVVENLDNSYAIIYTTQYTGPANGQGLGNLDIVAYQLAPKGKNNISVTRTLMASVPSLDKGQGQGEIQISPDASKLLVYNSLLPVGWFNEQQGQLLTFELGNNYLITNSSNPVSLLTPVGSFGGESVEVSKNGQYALISSNGLAQESATTGSQNTVYAFSLLDGSSSLVAAGITGNLRRGIDGRFYLDDPNSTGLTAFVTNGGGAQTDPTGYVNINEITTGILPIQNHKVYHEAVLAGIYTRTLDNKRYELTDHLGNVAVVVSDDKNPPSSNPDPNIDYGNTAKVEDYTNYYPFGMEMPGRTFSRDAYRYGYNGKEADPELYGNGNSYDYGFRIYNPRIGRWLSKDPLEMKYPTLSPYNFGANNPIRHLDPDGREIVDANGNKVELVTNIRGEILEFKFTGSSANSSQEFKDKFNKVSGTALIELSKSKTGQVLVGELDLSTHKIQINDDAAKNSANSRVMEKDFKNGSSGFILNMHSGNFNNNGDINYKKDEWLLGTISVEFDHIVKGEVGTVDAWPEMSPQQRFEMYDSELNKAVSRRMALRRETGRAFTESVLYPIIDFNSQNSEAPISIKNAAFPIGKRQWSTLPSIGINENK